MIRKVIGENGDIFGDYRANMGEESANYGRKECQWYFFRLFCGRKYGWKGESNVYFLLLKGLKLNAPKGHLKLLQILRR